MRKLFSKLLTIVISLVFFLSSFSINASTLQGYTIDIASLNTNFSKYITSLNLEEQIDGSYSLYLNNAYIGNKSGDPLFFNYYPNINTTISLSISPSNESISMAYTKKEEEIFNSAFVFTINSEGAQTLTFYPNADSGRGTESRTVKGSGGIYDFGSFSCTLGTTPFTFYVTLNANNNTATIIKNGEAKTYSVTKTSTTRILYFENFVEGHPLDMNYMEKNLAKQTFANAKTIDYSNSDVDAAVQNESLTLINNTTNKTYTIPLRRTIGYWARESGGEVGTGEYGATGEDIQVVCEWYDTACSDIRAKYGESGRLFAVYGSSATYPTIVSYTDTKLDYPTLYRNIKWTSDWTLASTSYDVNNALSKNYSVVQYRAQARSWSPWSSWTKNYNTLAFNGTSSTIKGEEKEFYKYRTWTWSDLAGWSTSSSVCSYISNDAKVVSEERSDSLCGTQYKTCTVATKVRCTKTRSEEYSCKVDSTCNSSYDCSYYEDYDSTCPYSYSCNCSNYYCNCRSYQCNCSTKRVCDRTDSRGNCIAYKNKTVCGECSTCDTCTSCQTCTGSQRCTKTRYVEKTCSKTVRCQIDGTCTRQVEYDDVCDSTSTGRYESCGTENKTCTLYKCQIKDYSDWLGPRETCPYLSGANVECQSDGYQYRYSNLILGDWSSWYNTSSFWTNTAETQYQHRYKLGTESWDKVKGNSSSLGTNVYYTGESKKSNIAEYITDQFAKISTITIGSLAEMTASQIEAKTEEIKEALLLYNAYNIIKADDGYTLYQDVIDYSKSNTALVAQAKEQALDYFERKTIFIPYMYITSHWRAVSNPSEISGYNNQTLSSISTGETISSGSQGLKLIPYDIETTKDTKIIYYDYRDPLINYKNELPENWQGYEELINEIQHSDLANYKIEVELSKQDLLDMKAYLKSHNYSSENCDMIREFAYIFKTADSELSNFLATGEGCKIEGDNFYGHAD